MWVGESVLARLEASERARLGVLGVAMAVSAAWGLWLTRGTVFFSDEFTYFVASRGFNLKALISPHNGHLIAVVRLIYATVFKLFGPDYVVFRLLEVLGIALVAGLVFAYAKRRVGATVALAPSVLLLFLGSSPDVTLSPLGITHVYCIAAGVAALLALDRDDTRGDVAACVLLLISVATFSVGLAFLAGAAVSVLLRSDRGRRAWIFLIPAAVYGAWLLAPKLTGRVYQGGSGFHASNILLIPNFVANAAGAMLAAVAGLGHDFSNAAINSPGSGPDITGASWGYVLAAAGAIGLVLRLRRGPVPRSLWTSLTVLLAFWVSIGLVLGPNRYPYSQRYVYDGVVVAMLVLSDGLAGIALPRRLLPILYIAAVLALGANLFQARASGGLLRSTSADSRTVLTAIELAQKHSSPGFVPLYDAPTLVVFSYLAVGGEGPVVAAVHRNGSFAYSLPELRAQPEQEREIADATLAGALGLRLTPAPPPTTGPRCSVLAGNTQQLTIHPPGILLRPTIAESITLRRFASRPHIDVGTLAAGRYEALRIPGDAAPDPWRATLSPGGGRITVCNLIAPE